MAHIFALCVNGREAVIKVKRTGTPPWKWFTTEEVTEIKPGEKKIIGTRHWRDPFVVQVMSDGAPEYTQTVTETLKLTIGRDVIATSKVSPEDLPNQLVVHEKTLDLWKDCDFYEILSLTRDASQEDIKRAFRAKILQYHPDRNISEESDIARRIIEAYAVLSSAESKEKYDKMLNNGAHLPWYEQLMMESFWRCAWEDGRIWWIVGGTVCIVAGLVLTFATAGLGAPVVIGVGCAAGALVSSGIATNSYLMSNEVAVNGIEGKELAKRVVISATIGAVGGALGGTGALVNIGGSSLGTIVANATIKAGIEGASMGTASTISTGITSGEYAALIEKEDYIAIAKDVLIGGAAGLVGGVVAGSITSSIAGAATRGVAATAIKEASEACNAGVKATKNIATSTVQLLEDGTKAIASSASSTVQVKLPGVARQAISGLKFGVKAGVKAGMKAGFSPLQEYLNEYDNIHFPENGDGDWNDSFEDVELSNYWFHFKNNCTLLSARMKVTYQLMGSEETKETYGDNVSLHPSAHNVRITFEVKRTFVWVELGKWDRIRKAWHLPHTTESFLYSNPVSRTFIAEGPLFKEAIVEVLDENALPIIG